MWCLMCPACVQLALPFGDRDRKGKLSQKYKVQGIPTLVFLGEDGKVRRSIEIICLKSESSFSAFLALNLVRSYRCYGEDRRWFG
jgi:hypothetical protein